MNPLEESEINPLNKSLIYAIKLKYIHKNNGFYHNKKIEILYLQKRIILTQIQNRDSFGIVKL
jgi:hypothetical protein